MITEQQFFEYFQIIMQKCFWDDNLEMYCVTNDPSFRGKEIKITGVSFNNTKFKIESDIMTIALDEIIELKVKQKVSK